MYLCNFHYRMMMDTTDIPIVTVSHNNYYYLSFMIKQLKGTFGAPKQIIVMDNHSTDPKILDYLGELEREDPNILVIRNSTNYGPRINRINHIEIYRSLPDVFCLTDSDILFSPTLPPDFIKIMYEISEYYGAEKVGFALDISEPDLLHDIPDYFMGKSLIEWELQFWERPIEPLWEGKYPLYRAEIDTTFCLINKKYENSCVNIRIGGDFTSKHLPWYRCNSIVDLGKQLEMAKQQGSDSTMAGFLIQKSPS